MLRFAILKEIHTNRAIQLGILRNELQALPDGEYKQRIMQILNVDIPEHRVLCELAEGVVLKMFKNLLCARIPGDRALIATAVDEAWREVAGLLKKEVVSHPELI
jgi:hypothetical protein